MALSPQNQSNPRFMKILRQFWLILRKNEIVSALPMTLQNVKLTKHAMCARGHTIMQNF